MGSDIEHRFDKLDSDIKNLWRWVVGLIAVFGTIVAILAIVVSILALAANII